MPVMVALGDSDSLASEHAAVLFALLGSAQRDHSLPSVCLAGAGTGLRRVDGGVGARIDPLMPLGSRVRLPPLPWR